MDINDEPGEMTPAELADFAMTAAGPSMYAKKTEHTPPGKDASKFYTTRWNMAIPFDTIVPKGELRVNFVETADPTPGSENHAGTMFIYTNISAYAGETNGSRMVVSMCNLISGRYNQKAKIYKILRDFVTKLRELCSTKMPYSKLMKAVGTVIQDYHDRNQMGELIPEAAEMSPADLARHSIEAAGPSMYARKISYFKAGPYGPNGEARNTWTQWLVEFPLPKMLPGQKVSLFISENHTTSERANDLIIFVSINTQAPTGQPHRTRVSDYETKTVIHDFTIITTTEDNRAAAYRVLHEFVNDVREICQGDKYHYIMQEIVNLARRVQEENSAYQLNPESEDPAQSSLEIAAVLLEMDPAELAGKVTQMSQSFFVAVDNGKFQVFKDGAVINYHPERGFEDLTADEREDEARLLQIVKFNVVEWITHYKKNVATDNTVFLEDIGYWTKEGTYEPPDAEWREMIAQHVYGNWPVAEAMTPKDLAIQSVGLPMLARKADGQKIGNSEINTYRWEHKANGYTVMITFVETRSPEKLIVRISPWVEVTPSIYDGGSTGIAFDVPVEGKADVYTRIWKTVHDIMKAHEAGLEKDEMLPLIYQVFRRETMLSDKQQEEKGRPVI